jgi:hypothetical protein
VGLSTRGGVACTPVLPPLLPRMTRLVKPATETARRLEVGEHKGLVPSKVVSPAQKSPRQAALGYASSVATRISSLSTPLRSSPLLSSEITPNSRLQF